MKIRWQTATFEDLSVHEMYAALRLRQEVFVVEQTSIYLDLDDFDQVSIHILVWQGTSLLGYQRCLPPGSQQAESSLGRIVLAADARGTGLGKALVQRGIEYNFKRWPGVDIRIHAQAYLEGFYGGLGFVSEGEIYQLDGIPHIEMVLRSR